LRQLAGDGKGFGLVFAVVGAGNGVGALEERLQALGVDAAGSGGSDEHRLLHVAREAEDSDRIVDELAAHLTDGQVDGAGAAQQRRHPAQILGARAPHTPLVRHAAAEPARDGVGEQQPRYDELRQPKASYWGQEGQHTLPLAEAVVVLVEPDGG
jgi:hypothetical protein